MIELPDWIVQISTIVSNILVTIAAIWGINQWRDQIKFGDQYKTARKLRGLSLAFKREFGLTRRDPPLFLFAETKVLDDLIKRRQTLNDDFCERCNHLDKLYKIVGDLYDESINVEGFIDEKEGGLTIPLENAYKQLNGAFKIYKQLIETCDQETLDIFLDNRNIIFSDGNDEFSKTVETAVKDIRKKLKKYLP